MALYGLGGVGKTQLALEYVYENKSQYEQIYWISAATEATLITGFGEIARRTNCVLQNPNIKPSDIAEAVVNWLNGLQNWLLVIDNLDEINVIDGYLPNSTLNKHILYTTRNPNAEHIPAEGLQVKEYDVKDAMTLLITRLGYPFAEMVETTEGRAECAEIVKELGYLPLAIEQASAYIREEPKDLFRFIPSYRKNRKRLHSRSSSANRIYYKESVATMWLLSFQKLKENNDDAVILLQLLAFLNPDGILRDFLEAGSDGLSDAMQAVIGDNDKFDKALSDLECLSLIRRQVNSVRQQTITIHRVIQYITKDEMQADVYSKMEIELIRLCSTAFPTWDDWKLAPFLQCRRFQDQLVLPLSSIERIESNEYSYILQRVGVFLQEDGKYQQATEMLSRSLDIMNKTREQDDPKRLAVMAHLASTYESQGKWEDAFKLQDEVLEARIKLLGKEHPDTLMAMGDLASTYWSQGKWEDAVKLEEEVMKARIRLLGKSPPRTPARCVRRAAIMQQLQTENGDRVSALSTAEAAARRAHDSAVQQMTKVTTLAKSMAAKKKIIQGKVNTLDSAAFSQAMTIYQRTRNYPNINLPTANTVGAEALRYAMTRRGDEYVWGAAGPSTFDCSGLVMWAYAQVGISLPHYTVSQYNMGEHISRSQLEPGDLVFFYAGIDHVGIYLGDGLMR